MIGISLLAMAARALFGLGAGLSVVVYTQSLSSAALVSACVALGWRVIVVPEQHHIWLPLTAGVAAYTLGTILWAFWLEHLEEPPFPSLADPPQLAIYPLGDLFLIGVFFAAVLVSGWRVTGAFIVLAASRREAHTDELTGLPNRRALNLDPG